MHPQVCNRLNLASPQFLLLFISLYLKGTEIIFYMIPWVQLGFDLKIVLSLIGACQKWLLVNYFRPRAIPARNPTSPASHLHWIHVLWSGVIVGVDNQFIIQLLDTQWFHQHNGAMFLSDGKLPLGIPSLIKIRKCLCDTTCEIRLGDRQRGACFKGISHCALNIGGISTWRFHAIY